MENTGQTESILGRGLYSIPEAARLIGVAPRTLRRWAAGYDFKGRSGALRFSQPVARRELEAVGGHVELTFLDLIEFLFISHFTNEGVSLYTIRRAAETAAQIVGVDDHPFTLTRFKTDGRKIFAVMQLDERELPVADRSMLELDSRQHVFAEVVEPFLRQFDYDVERVNRWWPLGRERHVVVDPKRNLGAPVLDRYSVPVDAVLQFATGRKLEEVAEWYEIPEQAVRDAVYFGHRLKAA